MCVKTDKANEDSLGQKTAGAGSKKARKSKEKDPDAQQTDVLNEEEEETEKSPGEFSDEEYLTASPVVLGFAFAEKMWLEFAVSNVKEVHWNESAYESLVLEPKTKDIVKVCDLWPKPNSFRILGSSLGLTKLCRHSSSRTSTMLRRASTTLSRARARASSVRFMSLLVSAVSFSVPPLSHPCLRTWSA